MKRLQLNRLSPEAYEGLKRQELTIQKLRRLIELSADTSGIDSKIQISGNEKLANAFKQQMINDIKAKTVKSFIEGAKENITITVHEELLE